MKIWRKTFLFCLGGTLYCGLELLWRGRTYGSMFLLGGICFLFLGKIGSLRWSLGARAILGGLAITMGELLVGLWFNRNFDVWDYRNQRLNICGQICPLYTCFWVLLSPVGWLLYRAAHKYLPHK